MRALLEILNAEPSQRGEKADEKVRDASFVIKNTVVLACSGGRPLLALGSVALPSGVASA